MADYGVNINLRIKGQSGLDRLNSKVKELTKSVDNIRQIDIMNPRNTGGAFGKKARDEIRKYRQDMDDLVKAVNNSQGAFGKTASQQRDAADALELFTDNLTIGTKAHKDALAATNKQNAAIGRETKLITENTKAQNQNNKSQQQGNKLNDRSTGSALKSGLISGAFPLLFGQGPLGGAAGFAGGFVGTKMGGQMGGFAGGLVATALLQQLTTLKSALDELGGSFDVMTPNIDKLTESLGLAGTAEGRRLKMIERTQGAHVALEVATEKMNQMIGEEGVKQLKEFSELSKAAGNNFKIGATKFQVFAATVLNFLSKISGFGNATKKRTIEEGVALGAKLGKKEALDIQAEQKKIDAIPKVDQLQLIPSGAGGLVPIITKVKSKEAETAQLILDKRKQEFKVVADKLALDIERQDLLDEGLKSITDQNTFLQNQLNLGKQGAEIEKLKAEMADKMKIAVEDLKPLQVTQIEDAVKLKDELTKINELYSSIASTIETGLVDAIEGAINGTKTLGDVARSVFTQIQRSLIQFGVNSFLGGLPGIGKMFRAEGGPVKRGGSFIVGERGPELFTPGVSGMITPNHALGGSTSVVVNVDASGSSVEGDEQGGRELGRVISAAVQSELIQQKRPGGLLA
mgnify:CR=1 FL=1